MLQLNKSWVEFPKIVFPSIDLFLNGQWPKQAETVTSLELPPSKTGVQSDANGTELLPACRRLRQNYGDG